MTAERLKKHRKGDVAVSYWFGLVGYVQFLLNLQKWLPFRLLCNIISQAFCHFYPFVNKVVFSQKVVFAYSNTWCGSGQALFAGFEYQPLLPAGLSYAATPTGEDRDSRNRGIRWVYPAISTLNFAESSFWIKSIILISGSFSGFSMRLLSITGFTRLLIFLHG